MWVSPPFELFLVNVLLIICIPSPVSHMPCSSGVVTISEIFFFVERVKLNITYDWDHIIQRPKSILYSRLLATMVCSARVLCVGYLVLQVNFNCEVGYPLALHISLLIQMYYGMICKDKDTDDI